MSLFLFLNNFAHFYKIKSVHYFLLDQKHQLFWHFFSGISCFWWSNFHWVTLKYTVTTVSNGTQITDFLLPVREFLEFCDSFLFCGNGNLSTFRNEYKALLVVKIFVWSIRNFWHQAVLCIRCGRYSNYRFSTSNPRFLLTKIEKMWVFVIRPNLSILRKWRFLGK